MSPFRNESLIEAFVDALDQVWTKLDLQRLWFPWE